MSVDQETEILTEDQGFLGILSANLFCPRSKDHEETIFFSYKMYTIISLHTFKKSFFTI